jgi:alcohol dehydrogenase class IV
VPADSSDTDAANGLIERLQNLIVQFHLPARFRDVDINRDRLQLVASRFAARGAPLIAGQPASEDEVMELLECAL